MQTIRLPVIGQPAVSRTESRPGGPRPASTAATRWHWCLDAKIVRGSGTEYNILNFATGKIRTVDEKQGRLLTRVSGLTIPFALPAGLDEGLVDSLRRQGILIPAEQLADYEARIRARIARNLESSHGLIIMPTEKCNFRCTYCYESFEKGRMTAADADALSRAITRIAGSADQFGIGFFGGEPLMCADLVLRFSRDAFRTRAARGLPYAAGVTTNAHYLEPALFDQLLDVGVVSFQITVDGDRAVHDRQRVTIKGAPTFDRIVGHLRAMARSSRKFQCIVRCNTRPEDAQRLLDVFDEDLRPLRNDSRFVIAQHLIWASNRKDLGSPPRPEQSEGCATEVARPIDSFLLGRELEAHGLRTTTYGGGTSALASGCYAGKPNWFVVGADLTLYKCTVVFDREENQVGRVNPDGTFTVDADKQELWTGSNAVTDPSCGTCHLRSPCSGLTCPLKRFSTGHKACHDVKQIESLRRWSRNRVVGPAKQRNTP